MQFIRQSLRHAIALSLVFSAVTVAQEADEGKRHAKEVKRDRDKPAQPDEARERARDLKQREWDRRRPARPAHEQNPFADLGELNVVDKAFYTVAELLYQKEEYENAIKELSKVVGDSPDERARSGAHLVAGHIYRFKRQDNDKAIAEYKQVTGDLADRAVKSMIQCYEATGQTDQAAKVLEERLMQATRPQEKAFILNEIASVYRRARNIDQAIETLRRIPQMITYEEAEAIRLDRGHGGAFPMDKIREQLERLRAAGRFEDAERLEQKVREMQEKLRGARRDKAPEDPAKKAPKE